MKYCSDSKHKLKRNSRLYTGQRLNFKKLFVNNTVERQKRGLIPFARKQVKFINHGHHWKNWKYKEITDCAKIQQPKFQQQLKELVFDSWMKCKRQLREEVRYRQVCISFEYDLLWHECLVIFICCFCVWILIG